MADDNTNANMPNDSLLSLSRLRDAFAAMLQPTGPESAGKRRQTEVSQPQAEMTPCEINPRSVVEAMLFVGRPDNGALSARELAAAMRGVSPSEIDAVVHELNSLYDADETPYYIEQSGAGYRLVLRGEFGRMRDKFFGRAREAKLSPTAIEVLSIIAYSQPTTAAQIDELRGTANGAALSTLVRRRLIRLIRPDGGAPPHYATTERFLKLFGLDCLEALPRSEELEKV